MFKVKKEDIQLSEKYISVKTELQQINDHYDIEYKQNHSDTKDK